MRNSDPRITGTAVRKRVSVLERSSSSWNFFARGAMRPQVLKQRAKATVASARLRTGSDEGREGVGRRRRCRGHGKQIPYQLLYRDSLVGDYGERVTVDGPDVSLPGEHGHDLDRSTREQPAGHSGCVAELELLAAHCERCNRLVDDFNAADVSQHRLVRSLRWWFSCPGQGAAPLALTCGQYSSRLDHGPELASREVLSELGGGIDVFLQPPSGRPRRRRHRLRLVGPITAPFIFPVSLIWLHLVVVKSPRRGGNLVVADGVTVAA